MKLSFKLLLVLATWALANPALANESYKSDIEYGLLYFIYEYQDKDIRTIEEYNQWVTVICNEVDQWIIAKVESDDYTKEGMTSIRKNGSASIIEDDGIRSCEYKEIYQIDVDRVANFYTKEKNMPEATARRLASTQTHRRAWGKTLDQVMKPMINLINNLKGEIEGREVSPISWTFVFKPAKNGQQDMVVRYD